jgi:hypothetical protein
MIHRNASLVVLVLLAAGCSSTSSAPCKDTQAAVESVAKQHPDCVRLTVHAVPPSGGSHVAVASTMASKLGKPSDPEDLKAMQTGEAVLLDEPGAIDVTLPIMQKDGKWNAACGVTLKAATGADRQQLVAKAKQIASAVEAAMAKEMAKEKK